MLKLLLYAIDPQQGQLFIKWSRYENPWEPEFRRMSHISIGYSKMCILFQDNNRNIFRFGKTHATDEEIESRAAEKHVATISSLRLPKGYGHAGRLKGVVPCPVE